MQQEQNSIRGPGSGYASAGAQDPSAEVDQRPAVAQGEEDSQDPMNGYPPAAEAPPGSEPAGRSPAEPEGVSSASQTAPESPPLDVYEPLSGPASETPT